MTPESNELTTRQSTSHQNPHTGEESDIASNPVVASVLDMQFPQDVVLSVAEEVAALRGGKYNNYPSMSLFANIKKVNKYL